MSGFRQEAHPEVYLELISTPALLLVSPAVVIAAQFRQLNFYHTKLK
jgi:hypothetical protein